MKIAIFTYSFDLFTSGTSLIIYNMAKELKKKGHDVKVFTTWKRKVCSPSGIFVRRFKDLIPRIPLLRYPEHLSPSMFKLLLDHDIKSVDVLHSFGFTSFPTLMACIIAGIYRKPLIITTQYRPFGGRLKKILHRFLFTQLNIFVNIFVVECRNEMEHLRKYSKIPEKKVRIIHDGVDLKDYIRLPDPVAFKKRFGINKSKKILLYVGRLGGRKVLEFINYAAKNLLYHKDTIFVTIGNRLEISKHKELANISWLNDKILSLGRVSSDILREAYSAADVFVFPSPYESFGLVLLEAAACGTPIVSTRVGVAQEIVINGYNGFLCDVDKIYLMPELCLKVLHNSRFKDNAMKLRFRILDNYNWENTASRYESIYQVVHSNFKVKI